MLAAMAARGETKKDDLLQKVTNFADDLDDARFKAFIKVLEDKTNSWLNDVAAPIRRNGRRSTIR